MEFDAKQYQNAYLKARSAKQGLPPDDLIERYAIDLGASETDVAKRVRDVRAYWNVVKPGARGADVAILCRAEDDKLKSEHGDKMLQKAWWTEQANKKRAADDGNRRQLVDRLKAGYGRLGVISQTTVEATAATFGGTPQQVADVAQEAGLSVVALRPLPEPPASMGARFGSLLVNLQGCGARTIPELLHPGSGEFSILSSYKCIGNQELALDVEAVANQIEDVAKKPKSVSNDARRDALQTLQTEVKKGMKLAELALAQFVELGRELLPQGVDAVADALINLHVEKSDAAAIAVLLADQSRTTGITGIAQVNRLLDEGRLGEAHQAAQSMPQDSEQGASARKKVEDARALLDALLSDIRAAVRSGDELKAASLLLEVRAISVDDAEQETAAIPLAPVIGLRLVTEKDSVKLFWQRASGHIEGTLYMVTRSESRAPSTPNEGTEIATTSEVTTCDARPPVARSTYYSVFALAPGRPSSRPTSMSTTILPTVTNVSYDVGPDRITVHWSAHPSAVAVEVWKAEAGQPRAAVKAVNNTIILSGLSEGVPVHFEFVAVYRSSDGVEMRSEIVHADATPRSEARPIAKLRAGAAKSGEGARVRISWNPVDHSDVRILRSRSAAPWSPGQRITESDVTAFGTEVIGKRSATRNEEVLEAEMPTGMHHLVAVSIGGMGIVVGASAVVGVTDPVRNLQATVFASEACLSWEWPDAAQMADVCWEVDDESAVFKMTRAAYRSGGGARVPLGKGPTKVKVYATLQEHGKSYSSPPASLEIRETSDAEVRYSVSSTPALGGFGGRSKKFTFTAPRGCADIQVQVVASAGRVMPSNPHDKTILLDTNLNLAPGDGVVYWVTVPKGVPRPYWVRCFLVSGAAHVLDPPTSELKG